ncbi:MAG: hypothetical protein H7Y32_12900, partial [Chloroflexales bacterium]|nr:hypothetical protein [Chloroflexales bacterium]
IRDELPYPLTVFPRIDLSGVQYVIVSSTTGGAGPLRADLDIKPPQGGNPPHHVVTWQGTLAPNAEITLTFLVRVVTICQPNQQTATITNIAQAQVQGASAIRDQVDFSAKCPGYNELDIEIGGVNDPSIDPTDLGSVLLGGTITNNHARPVTLGLTGLRNGQPTIALPSFQQQITLGPGESKPWEFSLNMEDESTDELTATADAPLTGGLAFCILPGEGDTQCPDAQAFPFLHGQGQPINITRRPRDLGDAPDSTNHFNMPMSAYPNVQANFPTVFDPATGLPEGPLHAHPRPLHLGPQVSREAEADIGPDQDALNNIVPQNNNPNNDRFDDGVNPNLWNLAQCQTSNVPVRVFISPQAEAWFQQQNETAYLNIWLDANRDGDWADGTACGANAATEHIVIDFPVDVAALGAGLQIVNVPTKLVPWPAALEQAPAWVRVTLSERPSNKTLQFGATTYGDGRGHPVPFRTGETEDYILHPEGNPNAGPNVGVQISGAITPGAGVGEQSVFKIDYANDGSRPASGAVLTLTKPEQLRDLEVVLLEAPGIPASDLLDADMEIKIKLPTLPVGTSGSITLGWATSSGGLAAAGLATTDAYSASVAVTLGGDTDASDNAAAANAQRAPQAPIVAAQVGTGQGWGFAETTCRNTVNLAGLGVPGAATDLLVDGKIVTTIFDDPFFFDVNALSDGRHTIQAVASGQTSAAVVAPRDPASGLTLDVNQSLPIDPLSLTFTDSQGRSFHPSTLGFSFGASNPASFLRSGETYQVAVDSCVDDPNMQVSLSIIAVLIALLNDDDGDGRYSGSFTYNPGPQTAAAAPNELRLHVASGGTTQSFAAVLGAPADGKVRDALTRQPLANASVAA